MIMALLAQLDNLVDIVCNIMLFPFFFKILCLCNPFELKVIENSFVILHYHLSSKFTFLVQRTGHVKNLTICYKFQFMCAKKKIT